MGCLNRLLFFAVAGLSLAGLAAACQPVPTAAPPLASATAPALASAEPTASLVPPTPLPTTTPQASPSPVIPTAAPTQPPTPTAVPEITLLLTGDINPGRCVYAKAKQAEDMTLPYQPLAPLLQAADITVGSLDGTLSDINPPPPCVETHRNLLGPAEMVQGLQYAGYDVITVATNHARDCGLVRGCVFEALLDTRANLLGAGILPAGTGADLAQAMTPAIIEVQGVRFAFLGFTSINAEVWATESTPGAAPLLPDVYREAVRQARQQADVVVALPHWGREFRNELTWEQSLAAQAMVEAGATLVVGNHPHRVQAVETFPSGAVAAYSLGNFVFDMTWSDGTLFTIQGIMLQAAFRGSELQSVELLPIRIHDDFQPRLAEPAEAAAILAEVEASMATAPRR